MGRCDGNACHLRAIRSAVDSGTDGPAASAPVWRLRDHRQRRPVPVTNEFMALTIRLGSMRTSLPLSIEVRKENDAWIADSRPLGVATQGKTKDEAIETLRRVLVNQAAFAFDEGR